ncbi:MAG: hypothetical protein QM731_16310 [Chitinophagaceae bacterium]
MRTTWIILLCMILAGGVMYFLARRPSSPGTADTISLVNTPDSIQQNIKMYVAYNPAEVYYRDSAWWLYDSLPLQLVPLENGKNTFNKNYSAATFYVTYDQHHFYDIEITKPDSSRAYDIRFSIKPIHDTLAVIGTIDDGKNDVMQFSGPMLPLYHQFVLTYNNKLSAPLLDSNTAIEQNADKTITIIKN